MKVNLNKQQGNSSPGAAAPKNEIVIIEVLEDFVFPATDETGIEIIGNFILPEDDKMVKLYSTKSKTEASMETEGEEDSLSFKSMFKAQHPGNRAEVKKFVQFWTGKSVIVLHKACGDDYYEVMGTPCSPLQLKSTKKDDNDGRFWSFSFEPFAKSGFVPKEYRGALVFAEPTQVDDVTAINLTPANGSYYKLPSLAVTDVMEFASITLDHGKVVSLIGSGGVAPATLASAVSGLATVVLANGTGWTAINKAVIHLKVFKAGATTYLFELSRE
ncbi:MAG: hypothetical protein K2P85_09900 [Flavobacteriaceae bacterium]|nr:hypothetical protein [Flavobacteriaceae bacterium]